MTPPNPRDTNPQVLMILPVLSHDTQCDWTASSSAATARCRVYLERANRPSWHLPQRHGYPK